LDKLRELNLRLGCGTFILPGRLAAAVDDDWLEIQRATIEEAQTAQRDGPLMAKDENQIARLLEAAEHWTPQGYYIVCEHPNGRYLAADPNWIANVVDLAAGLRLRGAE
jgi:hypothetical protein